MKSIVCPTDFSPAADNAVVFAAKLAKKLDATLHLFNAQLLGDLTPEEALFGADMNVQAAKTALDQRCLEVSKVFKISCYGDTESSAGTLMQVLGKQTAGRDLIVMGTNGEDDLFQHLFGSNTYRLISKTSIPVIVVPETCIYREIRKIVYAYDFWRQNNLPMAQIATLAERLGSSLIVLQVMESSPSLKAEAEVKQWQQMLRETYGGRVALTFDIVYNDNIGEGIDRYFVQSNGDLLAVCSQNYDFPTGILHRSIIRSLSKRVDYPVLVFHK